LSLRTLNLGIESWVKVSAWTDEDGRTGGGVLLGYAKLTNGWCLAIREYQDDLYEGRTVSTDTVALADAPRGNRLEAIDKLPSLMAQLKRDAQSHKDKIVHKLAALGRGKQ
jgi:hypothetical protein